MLTAASGASRYCLLAISVFPLDPRLIWGRHCSGKENKMPSAEVNAPVSSATTDRSALGVGWIRPGAVSIGTQNPSFYYDFGSGLSFEFTE